MPDLEVVATALVGALFTAMSLVFLREALALGRARRRVLRRIRAAEAAAREAALDDPAFAPEVVLASARAIAATTPGRGLLDARFALLRVVNRPGTDDDRVVVRVEGRTEPGSMYYVAEHWTLARHARWWRLVSSSDEGTLGAGRDARGPLIPAEWTDEQRLSNESLRELAAADAVTVSPSELVAPGTGPDAALRDLSLVDGRFSPLLLRSVVDRLLDAWETAAREDDDRSLLPLAAPEAAERVRRTVFEDIPCRLRIEDVAVEAVTVTELDADASPPRLGLGIDMTAVRYLVACRTGDVVAGSVDRQHPVHVDWTLAMTNDADPLWRLVSSSDPAGWLPPTPEPHVWRFLSES